MDEFLQPTVTCPHCNNENSPHSHYCTACGNKIQPASVDIEIENKNSKYGLLIASFLFLLLISLTGYLRFFHQYGSANFMLAMYLVFDSFVLLAALFLWKDIKHSLKIKKIDWLVLSGVVAGSYALGIVFHYMVRFINAGLYHSNYAMYMFDETDHAILFSFLGICLQPALFEELAYRGAVYGSLKNHLDEKSIVIVSALLFAFSHLSPVGMIWLVPLGLILGWLRRYTKCIWYGVLFHMLYNFSAILLDATERGMIKL